MIHTERQRPTSMRPLAVVDLETTGASAIEDRITEIGTVPVDDAGARKWSRLIHPQTRIPAFIEQLTGITQAMVAAAPPLNASDYQGGCPQALDQSFPPL